MSCAASHTRRLDSIQRQALRLVDAADTPVQPEPASPLDSLEHRRDVAELVVFHKAQVQGVPHMAGLRQLLKVFERSTLTVFTSGDAVEVLRCRASQHQCTCVGRFSRKWNIFTAAVPHIWEMNTQSVKLAANQWRLSKSTPLMLVIPYDARGDRPSHWVNPSLLGSRVTFFPSTSTLTLQQVQAEDEGAYRCRVDFKTNPTLTFTSNLTFVDVYECWRGFCIAIKNRASGRHAAVAQQSLQGGLPQPKA
ncbi:hypothetical protein GWK47_002537 [Chionoecetes opilio]|uniref:Ig-like domain-containing protein n=1 Tax=Chionoecetes opilio TaxID=41210 RepID=A0A8J4XMI8_CHIOP|nr:hypothetical protein GWK47_002537 [Chionoecetes opilio]